MRVPFMCGRSPIELDVPDDSIVYESSFPDAERPASEIVAEALARPVGCAPLCELLRQRPPGRVVFVTADITRPIPYSRFLPAMLADAENAGVPREDILILVATGMHRASKPDEHIEMFGPEVVKRYEIVDHDASDQANLVELSGASASGQPVSIDRRYVEAGFKILTGLVEPHFMAGFSGGRKTVCPGLASLKTIERFHGYEYLADPRSCNGNLDGNRVHEEALSAARLAGAEFTLNVVLNNEREVVRAWAGELEPAHEAACDFVSACACRPVEREADLLITSSGGYPLDATFYQSVKSFVSSLPAVRTGGTIFSFAGCSEGIGSPEYTDTMLRYAGRWRDFIRDIQDPSNFTRDQWQYQMHCKTLEKLGQERLVFATPGLRQGQLDRLSVTGRELASTDVEAQLQAIVDALVSESKTIAVFPEGPYAAPVAKAGL